MKETQYKAIILTDEDLQRIYGTTEKIKTIPSHNHFEAVLNPWHNDAFVDTPAEGMGSKGKRKYHLYSVDWCGNLIADYGELPEYWRQLRKSHLN